VRITLPIQYANSDKCAALPAVTAEDQVCGTPCLTCGRTLVCGLSLPVSLVEPNTIVTGVQRSLPVTVRHSLPELWQSAGVRYIPIGVSENQYLSD
jgi:hypothetical protein